MSKIAKPRPACVDCKFHHLTGNVHWCIVPQWDYVLGENVPVEKRCYDMRAMGGECGKVGGLYEAAS